MPTAAPDARAALRADCARCVGLCCVALPFARSADFAFDKPAGAPCPHLRADDACGIHDRLQPEGFPGCQVFDCFGAGPQAVHVTFEGRSWRDGPSVAGPMFEAFGTLRAVHEIRWYLADAAARDLPTHLAIDVDRAAERLAEVSASAAGALAGLDVAALRGEVGDLLSRVSIVIRGGADGLELRGRDLAGRDLRAAPWHGDLRGADLRRALLLGADLRGADLRTADLLGADLRGARLDGADLTDALFLTGPQLAGALGDQATRIPDFADRPAHWP